MEYMGIFIILYPKPYSIYLRGTINQKKAHLRWLSPATARLHAAGAGPEEVRFRQAPSVDLGCMSGFNLGLRVWGLGFWAFRFRVWGLGCLSV